MSQKSSAPPARVPAEKLVRDIRRATRKHHSAEDKIRIVLEGLRGEESIAALCRREAIAESLYYAWSKDFLGEARARHGFKRCAERYPPDLQDAAVQTVLRQAEALSAQWAV
jgi:transposase